MNNPPLASICIPLYNKQPYLARTLQAVLTQSYPNIEVVISDNGSTDGSSDVAQDYARRDSRIRYSRLENTVSINESWRFSLRLAKGEFLKLHSADDTHLPLDFLQRMIEPMLQQTAIEFTICATHGVVEYADAGLTQQAQTEYFRASVQFCRELINLPDRNQRAYKLLQQTSYRNLLGSLFALVYRRHCLPESHWRKTKTSFAWPESYPDWDFLLRLFLNHRGHFVDGVSIIFHYDANNPASRCFVDNNYDLLDAVNQMLMPLTVLIDPELAELRLQARPEELAQLADMTHARVQSLIELSDEVVAFEHPQFTAKLLPRLYQYIEAYRRNSNDWHASRRLRQLRLALARHWFSAPSDRVRQEYSDVTGQVHRLLLQSGFPPTNLDVREKELVQKIDAVLAAGLACPPSEGHWLALVLLVNFQSRPDLTLDKVPDWLRSDFAR